MDQKHPPITKSDNDIQQIRLDEKQQHLSQVAEMLKQKRTSIPLDQMPPAFQQHTVSPIRPGDNQDISSTELKNPTRRIMEATDSNPTSRATTPREGGPVGEMRNFGDRNSVGITTEAFVQKENVQNAVREFKQVDCDQAKQALALEKSKNNKFRLCNQCCDQLCKPWPLVLCAGITCTITLLFIIIALEAINIATKK